MTLCVIVNNIPNKRTSIFILSISEPRLKLVAVIVFLIIRGSFLNREYDSTISRWGMPQRQTKWVVSPASHVNVLCLVHCHHRVFKVLGIKVLRCRGIIVVLGLIGHQCAKFAPRYGIWVDSELRSTRRINKSSFFAHCLARVAVVY